MKTLSKFVLAAIVASTASMLLFQNCAPEMGPGINYALSTKDKDDPILGNRTPPPPGKAGKTPPAPTVITNSPPSRNNFTVVSGDQEITQDHQARWYDIAEGPITKAVLKVFWIERLPTGLITVPVVNGCYRVKVSDRIMFDLTQKNSAGQEAKWNDIGNPHIKWHMSVERPIFDYIPKAGQPFLFRVRPLEDGKTTHVFASIQGVQSNIICLTTK